MSNNNSGKVELEDVLNKVTLRVMSVKERNRLEAYISSKVKEAYERGIQDGLISVQQDILDKVGKGSYRLQGKGVESGALTVRDDISLKLSKLDQLSKELHENT